MTWYRPMAFERIRAIRWTGKNQQEIIEFFGNEHKRFICNFLKDKSFTKIGDYISLSKGGDAISVFDAKEFERDWEPIEEAAPQKQEAEIDNLELPL